MRTVKITRIEDVRVGDDFLDGLEARAEADPADVYLAQLVRFARAIQAQHPDAYAQAMIESTGERARPAAHPRATDPDQGD